MQASRTPITDANIAAHEAAVMARIASGELSREAIFGEPKRKLTTKELRGVPLRNAMTDRILEYGEGCAPRDLLPHFTEDQIATEGTKAFEDAIRRSQMN